LGIVFGRSKDSFSDMGHSESGLGDNASVVNTGVCDVQGKYPFIFTGFLCCEFADGRSSACVMKEAKLVECLLYG
jgi:hypothetical protein